MSKRPTHALVIALSLLICCGQNGSSAGCTPPQPVHVGPSGGEIAAVAIGVGAAATAVILVSVNHAHHNLKGCLFNTPDGVHLRTDELKDYSLAGSTNNLAVGNKVHLKGDREKRQKGASEQVFLVKELKKNYGPCSVLAASVPSPGVPASSPKPSSMQSRNVSQPQP